VTFRRSVFGGSIQGFFAESVVATIEVKSLLTAADIEVAAAVRARDSSNFRHLDTSITTGYIPSGVLSYVVAYDGPRKMQTAYS
jgi:hypothetical protein